MIFILWLAFTKQRQKTDFYNKPKIIGVSAGYQFDTSYDPKYGYLYDKQYIRTRYVGQFVKACKDKNISFVIIPVDKNQIDNIAKTVDGMIFTGGDDMNPKFFNQQKHPSVKDLEPDKRVEFDLKLIKQLVEQNKPILGVCLGMQEMNVAFGGDVIQDIPSTFPHSNINHKDTPAWEYSHSVKITKNSLLHNILHTNKINVSSRHHQAVGKIAKNFTPTALSSDGVIEAIECKECKKFTIGLQWHPESIMDENSLKIIQTFCNAVVLD